MLRQAGLSEGTLGLSRKATQTIPRPLHASPTTPSVGRKAMHVGLAQLPGWCRGIVFDA